MNILKLIRWQNLALIILVQVLLKYALFHAFNVPVSLTTLQFILLVLASVSIAAAGNIINDIFDIETDKVNKPQKQIVGKHLTEKTAYNLFMGFNIVGVGIGFYLANSIDRSGFFAIFVITSALLYIYASYLKQTLLVGNIVISVLVALSLLIVPIFDLLPVTTPENRDVQLVFFKIVLDYAIFAFLINLTREIIKDLEDIDGDYKSGMNTLGIAIGRSRAGKVAFVLSLLPLFATVYYVMTYLYHNMWAIAYFLILIIGPLLYISIKCVSAKTKSDYHHISNMLKIVMLLGMLSLVMYPFVLTS